MGAYDFDCGGAVVRVEASLADMSRPRVHLGAFAVTGGAPDLVIERHQTLPPHARVAEGPLGRCRWLLDGNRLDVEVPEGMYQGELVLRLGWYLVATRRGAVLIHACAVTDGRQALVASGKSGDGKSTLARLCRGAGLTLLTDEIVQLFPDGSAAGTPFRSDADNVGQPGRFPARYLVALKKAQAERLGPLSALDAGALVTSQCFDGSVFALPRAEANRRLLGFLSKTQPATLAFRKDPAAGEFVKGLLAAK